MPPARLPLPVTQFSDRDFFTQQERNRRRTRWIVAGFLLFFAWLGFGGDWLLWQATRGAPEDAYRHVVPWAGILMTAIAIGMVLFARSAGPIAVLRATGARELDRPATLEERTLRNVVDEMAIAAGIPRPRVWVIEDPDPNAFATGHDMFRSHVAVTRGLLTLLDRDELQAVVAHEAAHIRNEDVRLMTFLAALVGTVALLNDVLWRAVRSGFRFGGGGGGGRGGGKDGGGAAPVVAIVLVLWVLSWILAPLVTQVLALAVSRNREYLADASAAQFTRNPGALADALARIHANHGATRAIGRGAAHLCIDDPLGRRLDNREGPLADLFATHPPMAIRVARLRAMARTPQA